MAWTRTVRALTGALELDVAALAQAARRFKALALGVNQSTTSVTRMRISDALAALLRSAVQLLGPQGVAVFAPVAEALGGDGRTERLSQEGWRALAPYVADVLE